MGWTSGGEPSTIPVPTNQTSNFHECHVLDDVHGRCDKVLDPFANIYLTSSIIYLVVDYQSHSNPLSFLCCASRSFFSWLFVKMLH